MHQGVNDMMVDRLEFLQPRAVLAGLKATSRKQALQEISRLAGDITGLTERNIYDALQERERLGSTAPGGGVAVPHARMPGLSSIIGVFAQLDRPVPFDAPDDEPVDLLFVLLTPEAAGGDHLTALARISRILRDKRNCELLRAATTTDALYALLNQAAKPMAA